MNRLVLLLGIAFLSFINWSGAQNASVQFINNSPELGSDGGPSLDIYINDVVIHQLRDLDFREASPFLELPTDVDLIVDVRLNPSTVLDSVIYSFNWGMLEPEGNYIAVAGGLIGDFPGLPAFDIFIYESAILESEDENKIAIAAFHGSILLPKISFRDRLGEEYFLTEYGDFTGYTEFEEGIYYLDIEVVELEDLFFTHRLDLTGLAGQSGLIFASGPALGAPELGFFIALVDGTVIELPFSPIARVQWAHGMYGEEVDLYLGNQKVADDIAFKGGTPYMYVPAEQNITLYIAPSFALSILDAIDSTTVYFENRESFTAITTGVIDDVEYPFDVIINREANETSSDIEKIEYTVAHNISWIDSLDVSIQGVGPIVDSLTFGDFSMYHDALSGLFFIDFRVNKETDLVASFAGSLPVGAEGQTASIILSSVDPEIDDLFLFGVLADGTSFDFERINYVKTQIIHNSPDQTYDIYLNDVLILDSFEYRSATSFIDLPAGVEITIGFAPNNSQSVEDTVASFAINLDVGNNYHVIVNGILDNMFIPLELVISDQAIIENLNPDFAFVSVFAGSQGAPDLNVNARTGYPTYENLEYGMFSDYQTIVPDIYQLDVEVSEDDETFITYEADLTTMNGQSGLLLISGIFGGDPEFGLFMVLPDGSVIPLEQRSFSRVQLVHNITDRPLDIYLNDEIWLSSFQFKDASSFLDLNVDSTYLLAIADSGSTSSADAFFIQELELDGGKNYAIVVYLDRSDMTEEVKIASSDQVKITATSDDGFDFSVFNGYPTQDTINSGFINTSYFIEDLEFSGFSSVVHTASGTRYLKVVDSNDSLLTVYELPENELINRTFTIVLSDSDIFEAFAVFPDGTTLDLIQRQLTRAQFLHNISEINVDIYFDERKEVDSLQYRNGTPFMEIIAGSVFHLAIAPQNSESASESFLDTLIILDPTKLYSIFINGDPIDIDVPPVFHIYENSKEDAISTDIVELAMHHGSPRISPISLSEYGGNSFILGLPYGSFFDYLTFDEVYTIIKLDDDGTDNIDKNFYADFRQLKGETGILFVSGYADKSPELGLFILKSSGEVIELPQINFANIQIVHNSPETVELDFYVNDRLFLENLTFREASTMLEIPAGIDIQLSVYPQGETDADSVITIIDLLLEENSQQVLFTQGILTHVTFPFDLFLISDVKNESESDDEVEFLMYNGAPGFGELNTEFRFVSTLSTELGYSEIVDYQRVNPLNYILDITEDGNILQTFNADFSQKANDAFILFSSGIVGHDDAPFGMYILYSDGRIEALTEGAFGRIQLINNTNMNQTDVYWGTEKILEGLNLKSASPYIILDVSTESMLGIAPAESTSSAEVIAQTSVNLLNGSDQLAMIAGLEGDIDFPISIFIQEDSRIVASDPENIDILFFQGGTNAPKLDVDLRDVGLLAENIEYGQFSTYIETISADYTIDLIDSDEEQLFKFYKALFEILKGQSITLFSGGLVNGDPGFELWAALSNGISFPLEELVAINNFTMFTSYSLYPNPAFGNSSTLTLHTKQECNDCVIELMDIKGVKHNHTRVDKLTVGQHDFSIGIGGLFSGIYRVNIQCAQGRTSLPLLIIK